MSSREFNTEFVTFDVLDTNFLDLPDTPVFPGGNLVPFNHMSPLTMGMTDSNGGGGHNGTMPLSIPMPELTLKLGDELAPPIIQMVPATTKYRTDDSDNVITTPPSNHRNLDDDDDDNYDDDVDSDNDDNGDSNNNNKKKKEKKSITNNKRPRARGKSGGGGGGDDGGDDVDAKTARRRKRERENARRCRERKQVRTKELEAKLVALRQEQVELKEKQALSRIEQWLAHYDELLQRVSSEVVQADASGDELDEEVLTGVLADLKQSNTQINQIIGYNAKLMPLYLEMAHFRNIILWLYVTPMNSMVGRLNHQLGGQTPAMPPLAEEQVVDAVTSSNIDMVSRIKGQLQDEVQFTQQQLQSIVDFRGEWFEQIVNTFKSNQKVLQILQQMHTTQTQSDIVDYHNMVEELERHFSSILTPEQHARSIHWFNENGKQLERLLIDGTLSRIKNVFATSSSSKP